MPDITFRVQRNDPAAGLSELQDFVVPVQGSLTVLEALFEIQEKQDPSLAFRYCCRAAVCGSCAMYINPLPPGLPDQRLATWTATR